MLKGFVKVNIVGNLDKELKHMPLWSVSQQIDKEKIKLRFKYFQEIEGELELPSGFQPQRVEVIAHASGKKPTQVEKTYEWKVGES